MHLLSTTAALALTLVGATPLTRPTTSVDQPTFAIQGQEPGKKPGQQPDKTKEGEQGKEKAAEAAWVTDYKAALAAAKKQKKVVLMDFTGSDWCSWCKKLDAEVFSKPEFQQWAAKNVILLQLDFPRGKELPKELKAQNEKLQKEFDIKGFPTIILVDAKGRKVGQLGYMEGGPGAWIKEAEKQIKKKK